jgi:excinuclease ABC subunit C
MLNNFNEDIQLILHSLPDKPGIYQYFNINKDIIYVGKAKNLKKRVSSYFNKINYENNKLRILVSKIADIRYIVVETESDALLLENNLIKKYKPRYNILLKDDKTFPWICIKNETFPRLFSTRRVLNDGSQYFGPYTSVVMVRTILNLIRQIYPLRTCALDLTNENIIADRFKVCLEYHLGNCKGPCIGLQSMDEYHLNIDHIKNILKGNISDVTNYLKDLMKQYSTDLKYEQAGLLKEKLDILQKYQSKSTIVNTDIDNVDVFSILDDHNSAYVNFLKVVKGAIIQAHTVELTKRLNESEEEMLLMAITEIRERFHSTSKEIVVPVVPEFTIPGVKFTVPKLGDKKKLLELSERNVKYYQLEKHRSIEAGNPKKHVDRILETMMKDLRLKELPVHIECFDNSNIQGSNPVASCVVFKNAKPAKRDYRHFNIKTVVGADDFASMEEIIYRRYKRLKEENASLPQLIVIDGGKGQLHAAMNSLDKLELYGSMAIIGIAKRLEEIYFPGDSVPIYLDKNSETLKLIQNLRNEAHRFGITFHRDKRSKGMTQSKLDEILGIGEKTKEKLLKEFKTVDQIRLATFEEIENVIGNSKAKLLLANLKT